MSEIPIETMFLYGFGAVYLIVLALLVHALLDRRHLLRGRRYQRRLR